MPVKLNSAGGGSVTMDVGSTASNFTQNLPLATTTLVGTDTTQTLTNKTLTSPVLGGTPTGVGVLTSDVAKASTSGTTVDFTGIPSWVKRITVMIDGVSTSGSSPVQIQIGDSGGIENTGYLGSITSSQTGTATANFTAGYQIDNSGAAAAASIRHGAFTLFNLSGNTWVINGSYGLSNTSFVLIIGGSKTLSATLDRVRITTVNGTDTFDAGSINILYE